jgi:hypothetical protein
MFVANLRSTLFAAVLLGTPFAMAQQPAPAVRPAPAPLQTPTPHYISIPMTIDINAPVDKVWAAYGSFCPEWISGACAITSGTDRDFGAVRTRGNGEVLVGKTTHSYTYTQPPREGVVYNVYHGTVAAEALTPSTTRITYTLVYDNSMLADDAARQADMYMRRTRFTAFLPVLKAMAEGKPAPVAAATAAPAAGAPPPAAFLSPAPHYATVPMTVQVNAPADKVWARIGKFCDIGEWGTGSCTVLYGEPETVGELRSVGNEVMVAKTKYSYTYTQPLRTGAFYPLYHGTLEVVPLTATTSTLNYTLFFDNSNLADDAAREKDMDGRRTRFTQWLNNAKTLAEGGTLPPGAVAPAGGARPATAPAR